MSQTNPDGRRDDVADESMRADAGNPGSDRDFLSDLAPAQVDDDVVSSHLEQDGEEQGRDADAARA